MKVLIKTVGTFWMSVWTVLILGFGSHVIYEAAFIEHYYVIDSPWGFCNKHEDLCAEYDLKKEILHYPKSQSLTQVVEGKRWPKFVLGKKAEEGIVLIKIKTDKNGDYISHAAHPKSDPHICKKISPFIKELNFGFRSHNPREFLVPFHLKLEKRNRLFP